MQQVRDYASLASGNKKLVISIAVLLFLSTLALLDISYLVRDYIFDNRLTLVQIQYANDTFPFLRDDQLDLDISITKNTILNELWETENALEIAKFYWKNLELAANVLKNVTALTDRKITGNLSFDINIAKTVLMHWIQEMDYKIVSGVIGKTNFSEIVSSGYTALDEALENESYMEDILEAAYKRQDSLISIGEWWKPRLLTLTRLDYKTLSVNIPLSSMLTREENNRHFIVGALVGNGTFAANNTIITYVTLWDADRVLFAYQSPISPSLDVQVTVSNIGLFKKIPTAACSDELSYSINVLDGCLRWNTILEKCHCIPFRFRSKFGMTSTAVNYSQSLPYCSLKMYRKCYEFLNVYPCVPPCTYIRNQYSVVERINAGPPYCNIFPITVKNVFTVKNISRQCSRVRIGFSCASFVYAVYEEKYQQSFTQLLSQVGGDLSLYTGVSLLGIWQFCALASSLYRSYGKTLANSNSTTAASTNSIKKTLSTLLVTLHYLDEPIEESQVNNAEQELTPDVGNLQLKERVILLEAKVAKQHQEVLQRMDKMFHDMDKMFHVITSMDNRQSQNKQSESEMSLQDLEP